MNSVAIVVLNWNGIKDTVICLNSLVQLEYENYRIVVVDNGSRDNSVEMVFIVLSLEYTRVVYFCASYSLLAIGPVC
jgi:GT2 family glycosyltransferase